MFAVWNELPESCRFEKGCLEKFIFYINYCLILGHFWIIFHICVNLMFTELWKILLCKYGDNNCGNANRGWVIKWKYTSVAWDLWALALLDRTLGRLHLISLISKQLIQCREEIPFRNKALIFISIKIRTRSTQ